MLSDKLGIRERDVVRVIDEPENYFDLIGDLPDGVVIDYRTGKVDFLHWFVTDKKQLSKIKTYRKQILPNGIIWVSWPKGLKELNENDIRETALKEGLVDVKVCSIDVKWSGLKLMHRRGSQSTDKRSP